jgi:hypothetical protein
MEFIRRTGYGSNRYGRLDHVSGVPSTTSVRAEIAIDSINTGSDQRDAHVKSADFFDAAQYPVATLTSTAILASGHSYAVTLLSFEDGGALVREIAGDDLVAALCRPTSARTPSSRRRLISGEHHAFAEQEPCQFEN